jgi:hypothetical protein
MVTLIRWLKRQQPASWLLWASVLVHLPIAAAAVLHSRPPSGDLDNYYDIGTKAGRPYVDFQVEFPVATAAAFRILAPLSGGRQRFGAIVVALNLIADLLIVAALAWGWGTAAAACYAFIVIPLIDLYLLRMDLWPTVLATLAAAAWHRSRPVLAAASLVAGAAFKLWPVMFLPLLLVSSSRGRRRPAAALLTALGTGLLVLAGWLWVAGPRGLYQVLTFRGARGWEIESTIGAAWMLFDQRSMRLESGAWRIGTSSGTIAIVLFILGAVPCLWMIWRGARAGRLGAGWAGGISLLLVMSALLSAQYSLWIAPASGIAWVERDRRIAVLTGAAVFLTNLVFKAFHPLTLGAPRALALVLVRNLLLMGLSIYAVRVVFEGVLPAQSECG